ncbi:secretoglobin family 1D member-like [Equus asinus]|uniref:Uteroglobin n=3 Tax=Equus TaxID=9789 RepID=F6PR72_HORSE|nr:PREDICTED: secretoglobin family 1D member 2 [Equus przewalskii]XP_014585067.1 secretoglobin family 1D member [Equus caballus]XP_014722429.1 secretoglobin family 1D member-like [Equus asinus]XP_046500688.1 secretoglobin family 1D member-like [Equus quagga]
MRLSLPVLLVTLALCYYEADAVICPAALTDATQFLFISEALYKLQLQRFNAPPEAVEAKLQVKRCTDKISLGNRVLLTKAWVKVILKCGYIDLSKILS